MKVVALLKACEKSDSDGGDRVFGVSAGYGNDHLSARILDDDLGPKSPVARADLRGQFRFVRIDEFVAETGGQARLIFKAVEQIVFVAQSAESEQISRNGVVGLAARLPSFRGDDTAIFPYRPPTIKLIFPCAS